MDTQLHKARQKSTYPEILKIIYLVHQDVLHHILKFRYFRPYNYKDMGLSQFRHLVPKVRQAHIFIIVRFKAPKIHNMVKDIRMHLL